MTLHEEDHSKTMVKGAFILTIAAFVIKILSAVYRVPFQNIVGDVGFYIYQQIYPFYGIAIALSTTGFPVVISRLLAEVSERETWKEQRIIQVSFWFLSFLGFLWFGLVFLTAGWISNVMGDPHLEPLIHTISFSFLLLPFLSTWRGSYQAKGDMMPTALSQVAEQSIRVGFILVLSFWLVRHGYSLYSTGQGALAGSIAGGLSGFLLLLFFSIKRQDIILKPDAFNWGVFERDVAKRLFLEGTAICLSGLLLVLFQFIDAFNMYSSLVDAGTDTLKAKEWKGIYDRGQPLLQLGTVVATSLSLTLVPLVTRAFQRQEHSKVRERVRVALKISLVVGAGAAGGLISLIRPVNQMLFENEAGSDVLAVFCLAIFFSSFILTMMAVLQGDR